MQFIKREIDTLNSFTSEHDTFGVCQASFNSDGCITLRSFTSPDKTSGEIIVLSTEETHAIVRLFSKIDTVITGNRLPF